MESTRLQPRRPSLTRRAVVAGVVVVAAIVVVVGLSLTLSVSPPSGTSASSTSTSGAGATPGVALATAGPNATFLSSPPPSPTPRPEISPSPFVALPALVGWHVPVLYYHLVATMVEAGAAMPALVVSPALFAEQMRALRLAGWRAITAASLAADMIAGGSPPAQTFVLTLDDGHVDGFTEAYPILRANGFVATYYVVTGRIGEPGYLTIADLKTMAAAGMEIADHTISHILLGSASPTVAVDEIVGAQDDLQQLLGVPQVTFAYPFGGWDTHVVDDVRAAGFVIAFTRAEGCIETDANRFTLPRLRVGPSTTPDGLVAEVRACDP